MTFQTFPSRQAGGFGVGLIVGLLIGLALALGVALYITKVPVPFLNKVPPRNPGQDAAEAEKNRNWDPNSPLYGKNPARPSTMASGVVAPPPPPSATPPVATTLPTVPPNSTASAPAAATARASSPNSSRDAAAILADRPTARVDAPGTDPFTYFVQAGAYGTSDDAEQQRARLAMMGLEARLSEREQAGHTVHRVRLGPFDSKADADATRERLSGAGIEATLVRVQR